MNSYGNAYEVVKGVHEGASSHADIVSLVDMVDKISTVSESCERCGPSRCQELLVRF